jgi:hypothetical protein
MPFSLIFRATPPHHHTVRCRVNPSFFRERSEEDKHRRLASRAGARRSLNIVGGGRRGDFLTGVRTQGYTRGTKGVHRGTQGYTGVHRGTQGYTGVLRGTQGYAGVHRGTQGYTGVHRGTQGYPGVPRGTQRYTWVHRGTQGYKGVQRGMHTQGYCTVRVLYTGVHRGTQGCSEAHRQSLLLSLFLSQKLFASSFLFFWEIEIVDGAWRESISFWGNLPFDSLPPFST